MMLRTRRKAISAKTAGVALSAAAMLMMGSSGAFAYSQRVKSACSGDYLQFCPHYEEGSPKLRGCMRSHGRSLSPNCVRALLDAGLVSKKDIKRFR